MKQAADMLPLCVFVKLVIRLRLMSTTAMWPVESVAITLELPLNCCKVVTLAFRRLEASWRSGMVVLA